VSESEQVLGTASVITGLLIVYSDGWSTTSIYI